MSFNGALKGYPALLGTKKRPPFRVAWNFEFLEQLLLDVDAFRFRLRNCRLHTKLVDGADG